jgi:PIN domain nuclease of toxin-antitoxin system
MRDVVVDSSVVLALLFGEKGADSITAKIGDAMISSVNLTEVVSRLLDEGRPEADTLASIGSLALYIVDFTEDLAIEAGLLRAATKRFGFSLGDRACLATARREGLPALTCDRRWSDVELGIEIRQAR